MTKFATRNAIFLGILYLLLGLFLQPVFADEEIRYTKYNIHTQSKDAKISKASYANYTNPGQGHEIVPAGSEILITDKSRKSFTFTYNNGSKKVIYEFHKKRMGMSLDEYLDKITSAEPTSHTGLSKEDKKGIAEGKAYKGMSREGVLVALGYPATHRTPSLDSTSWTYWTNRFGTIVVVFDTQGLVSEVRD